MVSPVVVTLQNPRLHLVMFTSDCSSILRGLTVEPIDEGLKRALVPRQIAMMALGSAIGVGLFLGSTVTIRLAGPGVIITYVFGALIALVMGYALAEMAVVHPVAG